jgi:hypothetical protein
MWTRSSEDLSFAEYCKSTAGCIYWQRENVRSHILVANTSAKIEVFVGQSIDTATNESKARLKRGRPIDVKDKILWKRKAQRNEIGAPEEVIPTKHATKLIHPNFLYKILLEKNSLEDESLEELPPDEDQVFENNEISINYISTG